MGHDLMFPHSASFLCAYKSSIMTTFITLFIYILLHSATMPSFGTKFIDQKLFMYI